MRIRRIVNFEEACEEIKRHFLWELAPLFPKIDFSPLKRGREKIYCPFLKGKNPTLSYSSVNALFYCFECGRGGNIIKFYASLEKISFLSSVIKLAKFFKVKLIWKSKRTKGDYLLPKTAKQTLIDFGSESSFDFDGDEIYF